MFRKILFWTHLTLGVAAGLVIAVMSFTGAAIAFEKETIAWVERDARRVTPPAGNPSQLSPEKILERVRDVQTDLRVANLTLSSDPADAVALGTPRNTILYVNPYTGDAREAQAPNTRAFLRIMRSWHTHLNVNTGPGNIGATINAACNTAFLVLALSGLYLWWPRAFTWRVLRPSLWFVGDARGRARDWNWHNVFGFWSLSVLVVLIGSGVVLSYRWANNLVFQLAGEAPPVPGNQAPARPPSPTPAPKVQNAAANDTPLLLGPDAMLAAVQRQMPNWEQIVIRFNPPIVPAPGTEIRMRSPNTTVLVREKNQWPPFTSTTLTLNSATGEVRRTETFANLSAGNRARRWMRVLHSGEAFAWPGQLIAGLACLGGCALVYTGLALAWRRFFGRSAAPVENAP